MNSRVLIVLKLKGLSNAQLLVFANHILSSLTGNAHYATPFPALSVLQQCINNLSTALNAQQPGNKASTQAVHNAAYQAERTLRALAAYVQYTCNDDVQVALSSGFSIRQSASHSSSPITVKHGSLPGQFILKTKAVRGASYIWQYADNATPNNWITAATSIQSTYTLNGLIPAHTYNFRVAVVDKNGQQPFNTQLNVIAL